MEWGEYMEIVSIPDMLYNPSDRIPPYLIAKGNVAEPSGDDGTIGSLRAQQFVYRMQIAQLDRADGEANAKQIGALGNQLESVQQKIRALEDEHTFGAAYDVDISAEAYAKSKGAA
jgi:hypothetical protein